MPYYLGASESRTLTGVLPSFILRDRIFRSGEGGLRAVLDEARARGIDISFSGAMRATEDDVEVREGMPDLDWSLQLGPRLFWNETLGDKAQLTLFAPIRGAVSSDFSSDVTGRGFLLTPALRLRSQPFEGEGIKASLTYTARFANRPWQDYYYSVQSQYATTERPAYHAEGGYAGSALTGVLIWNQHPLRAFTRINLDLLQGAANADSPLLVDRNGVSVAVGLTWYFFQSGSRGIPE